MMRLPMPGASAYIVLPESMEPSEAKRLLSCLKRVVTPAIEFASGQEDADEAA